MRITEEEFRRLNKGKIVVEGQHLVKRRPRPHHEPGKMNKTESAYADLLEKRKHLKEIVRWVFEPIKFRLADKTFYTPDFLVVCNEHMEIHEVKGFMEEDANVKIKVVAEMFPEFLFVVVKKEKGEFTYREIV